MHFVKYTFDSSHNVSLIGCPVAGGIEIRVAGMTFSELYKGKRKKDVDFVWDELWKDKRIVSLHGDFYSVIIKIMKKMKKPSIEKVKGCWYAYRKTKEWNETLEIAKYFFIRMVENTEGRFMDSEFKNSKLKRRTK